ncbi:hypothetical protein, partial [Armatimonas sp.]|uniref:hypothetical protein n=1 Tax=Armatimonas sp. TaxID=1872638 RepID=UPI003750DA04
MATPSADMATSSADMATPSADIATPSNRLRAILLHIPWYSIQGKARLAEDTLLSAMTTTRAIA